MTGGSLSGTRLTVEGMSYRILEHTADLKIQAQGKNLSEVFADVLKGMFESCQPEFYESSSLIKRQVQVKAENLESLLVNFLSEVVYLSDTNKEAYFSTDLTIKDNELKGEIQGKKVKSFQTEIKAVTWHGLEIKKIGDQWQAIVLFDV